MWLHGRSPHTQRAYRTDAADFLVFTRKALRTVTVVDVQAWMDTLEHLAPASRARKMSSVKSLFGFGHRLGYLPFDLGRVVKRPKLKDTLAERILSEGDVHRLFLTAEQPPARRRARRRGSGTHVVAALRSDQPYPCVAGSYEGFALVVLDVAAGRITDITTYLDAQRLFPLFDLPRRLER